MFLKQKLVIKAINHSTHIQSNLIAIHQLTSKFIRK